MDHEVGASTRGASAVIAGDQPIGYRAFAPSDLTGVLAAFAGSWSADALTESRLTTDVLLDRNFDPSGFIIAHQGDRVIGAAYAVTAASPSPGVIAGGGWIPLLFVMPGLRRRGVGAELLERTLRFLRERGAHWANVAAYPPGYLIPGVDAVNAPEGVSFLRDRGFSVVETPVGMIIELADYETPADLRDVIRRAEDEGFRFGSCRAGDLPDVVRFGGEVTGGDWGIVLRDSVLRHGAPERIQIARSPEGSIVGFATFGSYEGDMSRFGPFGVDPGYRGRSLGRILLHRCLHEMKSRGLADAWFLWTDPDSPAGELYRRAGFRIARRFTVLQKDL